MKRIIANLSSALFLIVIVFVLSAQNPSQKIRIDLWDGGMVSNSLSDILEPNQGASLVNVVLDRPGRLEKRKGQALFVEDIGNTAFTGIGRFDPDRTTSYLIAASGTNIINALSSSSKWSLASPTSIVTSGQDTEFVQANDLHFVLNGFDTTGWWDGVTFDTGGPYPSSPPTATTGAWLRNFLFLGGATTETDFLYFSNNENPLVFDSSDLIKINTGDGQAIQHLEPYRLNELIIYKEKSVFVLDITGTTPLVDWTVQPITTSVGAVAPRAVVSLGNDQWFLSSEPIAVRSLVRSEFDKILVDKVSKPIQDIFDRTGDLRINVEQIQKSAAVLFDDKYILAIPTGTSLVNNTVVAFDFNVNAWYIIEGWFPADWIVFNKRLYYIDANDSRVIECFTGTDGDIGDSTVLGNSVFGFDAVTSTGKASVASVGINYQYVSKNFDFDFPENFKILDALVLEFGSTGSFEAIVSISLDDSDFASIGSVNLAGDSRVLPAGLPFALSQSGVARKTFQTQKFGRWKKLKFRVSQSASQTTVILNRVSLYGRIIKWTRIQ